MEHLISKEMGRVLQHLEGLDFIITGSLALCISGKLDREIHDLDIITSDSRVINQLDKIGIRLDETSSNYHLRFLCFNSYYVDVFLSTKPLKCTTKNIGNFKLQILAPEAIYLNKIEFLSRLVTHQSGVKILKDLTHYFNLTQ